MSTLRRQLLPVPKWMILTENGHGSIPWLYLSDCSLVQSRRQTKGEGRDARMCQALPAVVAIFGCKSSECGDVCRTCNYRNASWMLSP